MTSFGLPAAVRIREVGPRDGLQPESPLPAEDRARLIEGLLAAGLCEIEVAAFVSPKAVPAMAEPEKVVALLPRGGARYVALVPNLFGAERAIAAGVPDMSFTVSASATYNERNVRMSTDESLAALESIGSLPDRGSIDAVVSCAFGSPYEGDIEPAVVAALARRCTDAGATSLTFADTTGVATPGRIEALVSAVGSDARLHLHDTRGTALTNAFAAMQLGVTGFDTSVGGLGGSPFAHGAGGNLATEDLVHLLDDMGVETGVDLEQLLQVSALVADLLGRAVPSRVVAAGPRGRLAES